MEHKGRGSYNDENSIWPGRRGHKSSSLIALTVQCTYLQIGSSRSSGGFRKLPSFTAEDVDPRGDLGPPSGSPISTSVRPFWKGLLERRSPILPLCTGCCQQSLCLHELTHGTSVHSLSHLLSTGSSISLTDFILSLLGRLVNFSYSLQLIKILLYF